MKSTNANETTTTNERVEITIRVISFDDPRSSATRTLDDDTTRALERYFDTTLDASAIRTTIENEIETYTNDDDERDALVRVRVQRNPLDARTTSFVTFALAYNALDTFALETSDDDTRERDFADALASLIDNAIDDAHASDDANER